MQRHAAAVHPLRPAVGWFANRQRHAGFMA